MIIEAGTGCQGEDGVWTRCFWKRDARLLEKSKKLRIASESPAGIRVAGTEKVPLDGLHKLVLGALGDLVTKTCRSSMMRGYSVGTFPTATFCGCGTFATSPIFSDNAANILRHRRFRSTQPSCFRLLCDHFLMSNLLLENQFLVRFLVRAGLHRAQSLRATKGADERVQPFGPLSCWPKVGLR